MKKFICISALSAILIVLPRPACGAEIHDAVRAGDLAKVKALVARDPKVVNEKDARGRTPLTSSACNTGTARSSPS
jgi:ankyrin repeat protein